MSHNGKELYEFTDFRLDISERLLLRKGKRVSLPEKAFEMLCVLVRQRGHLVGKDALLTEVWADSIVEENNLDKNVSLLRQALGERKSKEKFIETVRGHGYRFVAEVRRVEVKSRVSRVESQNESQISNFKFQNGNSNGDEPPTTDERQIIEDRQPIAKDHRQNPKSSNVVALADWRHEAEEAEDEKSLEVILPVAQVTDFPVAKRKNFPLIGAIVFGLLILALGFFAFTRFRSETPTTDVPIKTIAVLPFKSLAAENGNEVLEMGMADTLISRLGNNREIVVRPLSSVRKFGNLEQDALAAGRALDVESVLDGNIQRWGDKIRVNVRLIKTADGSLLWTGTFDEKFTDIFVVQDAISRKVASALELRLSGGEQTQLEKRYTNNAEAYEFYLRGRYHFFKITPPEMIKAIGFYQQAIEADPNYALAYAGLADAYRTQAIAAHAPSKEVCPQAKQLATRALEIDESLADAHIVLGWVGFFYDWDWEKAEKELQRAIELAPNNSEAHRAYAHFLSILGHHEEAIAEGKRARELAPLTLITNALEGQFLFYAGRDTEAIARFNETLEIEPDFWVAHNWLGRVYIRQGRYPEAIAALTKARELSRGSTEPVTQLGYALAKSGNPKQAQVTLEELKSIAAEKFVPAYNFAMIYNGLGEKDEALNYLEKSFGEREVQMTFIKIDTRWDEFRAEPRFIDLMRRMNFE